MLAQVFQWTITASCLHRRESSQALPWHQLEQLHVSQSLEAQLLTLSSSAGLAGPSGAAVDVASTSSCDAGVMLAMEPSGQATAVIPESHGSEGPLLELNCCDEA